MEAETKTIPEHGEHFNESIVNEVILEDMKKNRIDHMKYLPGMEVLEESDVMEQVISAMQEYDYDNIRSNSLLKLSFLTVTIQPATCNYKHNCRG